MFRLIVVSALLSVALSMPAESPLLKKIKKGKIYQFDGIIGDTERTEPILEQLPESAHIRNAPQDPIVPAEPIHLQKVKKNKPLRIDYDEINRHQAQSAHYNFDSAIHDDINDQTHVRSESRDGTKVTGMYAYSDGFFHRTVQYVADENGYRVVKETAEKIGDGPQFNSEGVADVQGSLIGGYSIQIDDRERNPHYVGFNVHKPSK